VLSTEAKAGRLFDKENYFLHLQYMDTALQAIPNRGSEKYRIFWKNLRRSVKYHITVNQKYLTTSTAPPLIFGSMPRIEYEARNEPSMLNTTASVWGGNTAMLQLMDEWSPL